MCNTLPSIYTGPRDEPRVCMLGKYLYQRIYVSNLVLRGQITQLRNNINKSGSIFLRLGGESWAACGLRLALGSSASSLAGVTRYLPSCQINNMALFEFVFFPFSAVLTQCSLIPCELVQFAFFLTCLVDALPVFCNILLSLIFILVANCFFAHVRVYPFCFIDTLCNQNIYVLYVKNI